MRKPWGKCSWPYCVWPGSLSGRPPVCQSCDPLLRTSGMSIVVLFVMQACDGPPGALLSERTRRGLSLRPRSRGRLPRGETPGRIRSLHW